MKRYYLAYGSNLNLAQMKVRCKNATAVGETVLKDFRLVYRGHHNGRSYLTIERQQGSEVPVGIYEISLLDMMSLDKYEGYPNFYFKWYIPVKINNETKKALIYIMNDRYDYHLPSHQYIETCEKGYRDFSFDKRVLDRALYDTKKMMKKDLKRTKKK